MPDLTAVAVAAARVATVRVVVPRGALDVVVAGVVGAVGIFGVLSPLPPAPSPTTASVSCTGLVAAGDPAIGAAAAAGDAAGVAFERVARYPPTPAAAMHAVASAAKANRFDNMPDLLETRPVEQQALYPGRQPIGQP